jgi:organic hydroperoxide reductase OsmC/OhrA
MSAVRAGREHRYELALRWTGSGGVGTLHYRSYARSFEVEATGKPMLLGSADPDFRGDADRYNPEELLLAALSGCHLLSYLHLCAEAGVVVVGYEDRPSATMVERAGGGGAVTGAVLRPTVVVTQPEMAAQATVLHDEAHRRCFIASSVRFPVEHRPAIRATT